MLGCKACKYELESGSQGTICGDCMAFSNPSKNEYYCEGIHYVPKEKYVPAKNQEIYRATINQPFINQPLHNLHNVKCIVIDEGKKFIEAYFVEGNIPNMTIDRYIIKRMDK